MKFLLIITTLLLIINTNAQPDYYLDHTFKTEPCVGPVRGMTLLPNNELFLKHRGRSFECVLSNKYDLFAIVDDISGAYKEDFYSTRQDNILKVSNINNDVFLTFLGSAVPKILPNGQPDWKLFIRNLSFIILNDIIWLPRERNFLLSGMFLIDDKPRSFLDVYEYESMIKLDEGFRLEKEFNAPVIGWIDQSDTTIVNQTMFLESLSDGRIIFQTPGSNSANGHKSESGVFVMWPDGTIDTTFTINIDNNFIGFFGLKSI